MSSVCGVLGINGLHSSLGVQINSFLCCSFIFFSFFLGFPVFPVFLICMLVVTGDLSLPFILIGGFGFSLGFLFTNTHIIHNTHWSFFCSFMSQFFCSFNPHLISSLFPTSSDPEHTNIVAHHIFSREF